MAHLGQLVLTSPRGNVRVYFLEPGQLTLGRSSANDIVLRDAKASRHHARLDCTPEGCRLVDLDSRHGVFVDGERTTDTAIRAGQVLRIGDYKLELRPESTPDQSVLADEGAPEDEEFVSIEAGKHEPTIVESMVAGDATISEQGIEHSVHNTTVDRLAIHVPGRTTEIALTDDEITIGRGEDCTVVVEDQLASKHHVALRRRDDGWQIEDLESKNGTWVDGSKIDTLELQNGSNIRIGGTHLVFKAAVRHEAETIERSLAAKRPRRPVVVIPGIMGSELWKGRKMIWPDLVGVLKRPKALAYAEDNPLEPRSIARHVIVVPNFIKLEAYSRLVDFLTESLGYESGKDLLEFPYDWRQDNRVSARDLKAAIDQWRSDVLGADAKFTIIAHSMGSLVARYYVQCLGGAGAVKRLVLMGAPCFGSPQVVQGLLYGPRMLPLGIGNQRMHEIIMGLPSAYQLVPTYPCTVGPAGEPIDLHESTEWVKAEHRHLLESAREFHDELGDSVDVPLTCIFGYGVKTVTGIQVLKKSGEGWESVRFSIKKAGDNRVAEEHAFLKGSDLHPVHQYHGALWTDEDVRVRLRLELLN